MSSPESKRVSPHCNRSNNASVDAAARRGEDLLDESWVDTESVAQPNQAVELRLIDRAIRVRDDDQVGDELELRIVGCNPPEFSRCEFYPLSRRRKAWDRSRCSPPSSCRRCDRRARARSHSIAARCRHRPRSSACLPHRGMDVGRFLRGRSRRKRKRTNGHRAKSQRSSEWCPSRWAHPGKGRWPDAPPEAGAMPRGSRESWRRSQRQRTSRRSTESLFANSKDPTPPPVPARAGLW